MKRSDLKPETDYMVQKYVYGTVYRFRPDLNAGPLVEKDQFYPYREKKYVAGVRVHDDGTVGPPAFPVESRQIRSTWDDYLIQRKEEEERRNRAIRERNAFGRAEKEAWDNIRKLVGADAIQLPDYILELTFPRERHNALSNVELHAIVEAAYNHGIRDGV
jgi:hypothetical protein